MAEAHHLKVGKSNPRTALRTEVETVFGREYKYLGTPPSCQVREPDGRVAADVLEMSPGGKVTDWVVLHRAETTGPVRLLSIMTPLLRLKQPKGQRSPDN